MDDRKPLRFNKEIKILIIIISVIIFAAVITSSYAFFNYTRSGSQNNVETGAVDFEFDDGNNEISRGTVFPIDNADIDNTIIKTFSLSGHTTYSEGMRYNIYVTYGDSVSGKTRLVDDAIFFQFIPASNGNGFTNDVNICSTATSLTFVNGKALVASGAVKNTTQTTTKSGYTIKLWIDSSKISISSTTKRANNLEGNPSLADSTSGTTTATRYMRNDTNESSTITLYPAVSSQIGKIIYTTNEFSNSFYSFKVIVDAFEEVQGNS